MRLPTLRRPAVSEERGLSLDGLLAAYQDQLLYDSHSYWLTGQSTLYGREQVTSFSEPAAVSGVGAVLGVVQRRTNLFAQVRFAFKRVSAPDTPMSSDLFTTAALAPLDEPQGLLARLELDVATAGNGFVVRDGDVLRRLPPQWVSIAVDSQRSPADPASAWDARPVGYVYSPNNDPDGAEVFLPGEIAHYAPIPDPHARFRGMSYLRPVLDDVRNVAAHRNFLRRWWENSATPNLAVTFPAEVSPEQARVLADLVERRHEGSSNAGRTLMLGAGADVQVVGSNLKDIDSATLSAQAITALCMAAGVPVAALGGVAGMESTVTYSNVRDTQRTFADITIRSLWRSVTTALAPLIDVPAGAVLWPDPSGISALQADALDDAQVTSTKAQTMRTLIDGGYEPSSVRDAVVSGDLSRLEHTGAYSVQLLPPGSEGQPQMGDNDDGE